MTKATVVHPVGDVDAEINERKASDADAAPRGAADGSTTSLESASSPEPETGSSPEGAAAPGDASAERQATPETPPTPSATGDADSAADAIAAAAAAKVTHIRARRGWQAVPLRELWEFRDLLMIFALRDIQVRYKQAVFGVAWAVIQPGIQVFIYTVFFGMLLGAADKVKGPGGEAVPYAVFAMAGQVLWQFFSSTVLTSSQSLMTNADILRKIYMPRLIMPLAAFGATGLDFIIGLILMAITMALFGVGFGPGLLLVPLWLLATVTAVLGASLFLSALTVVYRDFKYIVPFGVQTLFFLTPVIYPPSILPERFRWLLDFNPMTGPMKGFRASVLGHPFDESIWQSFAISSAVSLVMLVGGLLYFARVERRFADVA